MKTQEIRSMTAAEMDAKLEELTDNLIALKSQLATKQLENPRRIREAKRDIARLKTIKQEAAAAAAGAKPEDKEEQKRS